jgi:hypothetical protein
MFAKDDKSAIRQRRTFLLSCALWFFLSGVDYSIVIPTIHHYLKSIEAETKYIGMLKIFKRITVESGYKDSSAIFRFLRAFLVKFFLYGQNDTFSHGQNDKNLPVLIARLNSTNKIIILS